MALPNAHTDTGGLRSIPSHHLPLEDEVADIVRKAMAGKGLDSATLAERSQLSRDVLKQCLDAPAAHTKPLRKIAFVLNLNLEALQALAHKSWYPEPGKLPPETVLSGFRQITTPFGADMSVNAYLLWDTQTKEAIAFDTGTDCGPILELLRVEGLALKRLCVTHTHLDHLKDFERLQAKTGATAYGAALENPLGMRPLHPLDGLVVGSLQIRVLGTPGHTPGGLSYYVTGLERPVVVVGDALFAGSMGGAPLAYEQARQAIVAQLLTLPDATLLAPGHGPLSTIGLEKRHNPFFAATAL